MKQIYMVTFSFKEDSPLVGNIRFVRWAKETKLYGAKNEKELQAKIDNFCADNKGGRRTHITVSDIITITFD